MADQVIIDDQMTAELQRLARAGSDLTPAMIAISGELLSSIERNFEAERDPLGVPWKKVENPPDRGTILRRSGHLLASMKNAFGPDYAMAGPSSGSEGGVYGAVHQFGARISAKNGKALNTPFGPRKAVTIPARPYMGWNDDLRDDVFHILSQHLTGLRKGGETA